MRVALSSSFASYKRVGLLLQLCRVVLTTRSVERVRGELRSGITILHGQTCFNEHTALEMLREHNISTKEIEWITFGDLLTLAKTHPEYWARDNHSPEECERRASEHAAMIDPENKLEGLTSRGLLAALRSYQARWSVSGRRVMDRTDSYSMEDHETQFAAPE